MKETYQNNLTTVGNGIMGERSKALLRKRERKQASQLLPPLHVTYLTATTATICKFITNYHK